MEMKKETRQKIKDFLDFAGHSFHPYGDNYEKLIKVLKKEFGEKNIKRIDKELTKVE
jgi:hypothetical protein